MKKIYLVGKTGKGKYALVDDDLYRYLHQWTWYGKRDKGGNIRAVRSFHGITMYLHYIIKPCGAGQILDHADGNTLNNQRSNLRPCFSYQNMQNSKMRKRNKTGFKGVHIYKDKFISQIQYRGKKKHLGVFLTKEEAARAYNEAARRVHKIFANLNPI